MAEPTHSTAAPTLLAATQPWWHALAHLGEALTRHSMRLKVQGLIFLVAILSASFYFEATPINGIVLCPVRRFTGIECAGCGMTRSWCAIAEGDLTLATALNPFGPVLMVLAIAKVVTLAIEVTSRRRLVMPAWQRVDTPLLGLVAASMLAFGIYRAVQTVTG